MTTISLLGGDWEILFADETVGSNAIAGLQMVRRATGASDTVYSTNALYSDIADKSDEFQAMGFKNPMLPVTPNAYTMENDYFIPRCSIEYLKEGAIEADWGDGIRSIAYTTGTDFVAGDVGRQVTGGTTGDTGTLLDFEVLPDGTKIAWIRPDDPTTDLFDNGSEGLSVTGDGGTGSVTAAAVSQTGTSLYSSIQVIGSVPSATDVYLVQDRQKMTDCEGNFQWWTTDTDVSLGIIDILVRVKLNGTLIADGDVEVFARRYTSLYDNFRLNVSAGGRSALPLSSSPDINNTTGYRTFTGSSGSGTFTVGNGIYVGASWATATKRGVITAATDGATPVIEYYLVGDLTDFANTDSIQEYDFSTGADADASCIAGTPAANSGGPTDTSSGEGGTVTIALGTTTVDHDGDAVAEPYSVTIDAQGDVSAAKVYERIKYVCRRGATTTDLFGAGVNIPGETYRGLEVQAEYDAESGTFTEGDDIDIAAKSNFSARCISNNTTDDYVMLTDIQTSLESVEDDDILRDESSDTVTVHAGGSIGINSISSVKNSPFGTFTGTQIFGARGVVFINPDTADLKNYILTDDNGVQRTPPNTVAFTANNTISGDRVFVARDTGTAGEVDKDQFGGLAAPSGAYNGQSDLVLRVAGSIDSEVPSSAYVRVVENTLQQEHHYVYASRTTGASGEFTLKNVNEGTGATSASTTNLIDTSATFNTTPTVEVGMLVRNTTVGKTTHVWEVTAVNSDTNLTVRALYGPLDATQDWDVTDTYEINRLIQDYAATDDIYDLLLDLEATSTSESNSFVKILSSDFSTVVNVRNGKNILPFTQNVTVGDNGASVTVVRTADTIAT